MKKTNKKGFTLIELLAVIVILALLVAVAIPAVTKYLNTARKGVFADDAAAAISTIRNKVIIDSGITSTDGVYKLSQINAWLEKKIEKSPYGKANYSGYVKVVPSDDGDTYSYSIYLTDGTYCLGTEEHPLNELEIDKEKVLRKSGEESCAAYTLEPNNK